MPFGCVSGLSETLRNSLEQEVLLTDIKVKSNASLQFRLSPTDEAERKTGIHHDTVNNTKTTARIEGIGGFVPSTVLDNAQLEQMVDTTDLWITSRTGIKQRRIVGDENLATSDMGAKAVLNLLENASIAADEVDCLILATATPDQILTPTASVVCTKSGLTKAWGFDLGAACSGFLYALSVGASLIESGRHKNVIVVGADKMSAIVNYEDRNTCILFGDGAGAVLLTANSDGFGVQQSIFGSDGEGAQFLSVPAGGSHLPASHETVDSGLHFVKQDGKTVFRHAVRQMGQSCIELLNEAKIGNEQVDWVVPHQANMRIIKAVSDQIGIDISKFKINIERYGNTTAATIPLALWDFKDDFKKGDNIVLTAFGAGFTWGSTYVKW